MTSTAPALPPRATWGREVEHLAIHGHPSRVYRDRPRSMSALLRDARRWGAREFVVEGHRRLSFDAFAAAVARVADVLRSRGLQPQGRVVLLAYNSIEWLAAFWAIHALGGVAVLANAWWSAEETASAIDDADPVLVIADVPGKRGLEEDPKLVSIAALRAAIDDAAVDDIADRDVESRKAPGNVDEDSLAVIMFTSGTTARAKGVMMSHRGLVANIQNLLVLTGRLPDEIPADAPGTVSLLTVPLFHLAGIQISVSTLLSGGRLVLLEGRFDPLEALRLIEREKVRAWGSIPTMVSRVVEHPDLPRFDVSSVRSIPMGGAAIPPALREAVQRAFPGVKKSVGSLYGCTEAGGVLAAGSAADLDGRPGCVGRPLPVVEIRIANADAHGNGEILARTPTATLGIWGDPAAIADDDGWIATGDVGRIEDGFLYLSGRSKDIVIRAGENIACAHVEECIARHPAVREVAVVALPHADLGEEVAAVVVLREGMDATSGEIARHAALHLGRFEVPTRWWIRRATLPTNAAGKIAKAGLRTEWGGS